MENNSTTKILLEIDNAKFKESFNTFAIYLLLNDLCRVFDGSIKYRTLIDEDNDETETKLNLK